LAIQYPHRGLCVFAVLADPRCCQSADVCAVCVLSERAIRVEPASILIVMALRLGIILPYAVIWNAADTVVKGPGSIGCLQAEVAGATSNWLPRTWNNLGTRHGHALHIL